MFKERIEGLIDDYVNKYQGRRSVMTKWRKPLVGFASAEDQLFEELKEVIGPSHALPEDLLAGARSIITYFLPFEEAIIESNIKGENSSKKWVVAYRETNQLIHDLNQHIKAELNTLGQEVKTVSATGNFFEDELISEWSHKHVAYIAGLGTFGLHKMLITSKGSAGRIGSLVVDFESPPTDRPEEEYCLYKVDGSCTQCVARCVNGSLQENAFDRHGCYDACLSNGEVYSDMGSPEVCGKCTVNVPCSDRNPIR
ncbi:epoxyqueuosine reductase [Candidatus Bipolaricaulota bacterium]|nr:epoxyqueuosine reductase [Candidatus Bipolaricaulota bacterium]